MRAEGKRQQVSWIYVSSDDEDEQDRLPPHVPMAAATPALAPLPPTLVPAMTLVPRFTPSMAAGPGPAFNDISNTFQASAQSGKENDRKNSVFSLGANPCNYFVLYLLLSAYREPFQPTFFLHPIRTVKPTYLLHADSAFAFWVRQIALGRVAEDSWPPHQLLHLPLHPGRPLGAPLLVPLHVLFCRRYASSLLLLSRLPYAHCPPPLLSTHSSRGRFPPWHLLATPLLPLLQLQSGRQQQQSYCLRLNFVAQSALGRPEAVRGTRTRTRTRTRTTAVHPLPNHMEARIVPEGGIVNATATPGLLQPRPGRGRGRGRRRQEEVSWNKQGEPPKASLEASFHLARLSSITATLSSQEHLAQLLEDLETPAPASTAAPVPTSPAVLYPSTGQPGYWPAGLLHLGTISRLQFYSDLSRISPASILALTLCGIGFRYTSRSSLNFQSTGYVRSPVIPMAALGLRCFALEAAAVRLDFDLMISYIEIALYIQWRCSQNARTSYASLAAEIPSTSARNISGDKVRTWFNGGSRLIHLVASSSAYIIPIIAASLLRNIVCKADGVEVIQNMAYLLCNPHSEDHKDLLSKECGVATRTQIIPAMAFLHQTTRNLDATAFRIQFPLATENELPEYFPLAQSRNSSTDFALSSRMLPPQDPCWAELDKPLLSRLPSDILQMPIPTEDCVLPEITIKTPLDLKATPCPVKPDNTTTWTEEERTRAAQAPIATDLEDLRAKLEAHKGGESGYICIDPAICGDNVLTLRDSKDKLMAMLITNLAALVPSLEKTMVPLLSLVLRGEVYPDFSNRPRYRYLALHFSWYNRYVEKGHTAPKDTHPNFVCKDNVSRANHSQDMRKQPEEADIIVELIKLITIVVEFHIRAFLYLRWIAADVANY
ncbi:hypothetical protein C8J57DRAFT_1217151 [Mycena rebaudengoi]|nr:hypothetical protein C8J57DRAFT_1217151 [Mycena rebaudengoi]